MSESKYKEFRNFMCNELGITRHDIETWTKEAVANEVHKLVSGQKMTDIAMSELKSHVRTVIFGSSIYANNTEMQNMIRKTVMKEIEGKINIKIDVKD